LDVSNKIIGGFDYNKVERNLKNEEVKKMVNGSLRHVSGWASAILLMVAVSARAFGAETYKNSTPLPPGIAMPDTLDTHFGTLHFFDGFPDKPSVEKLYDNLDFERAVQAYLLGLPVVSQWANRKGMLEWGPANSTVPMF
jgi:hypothetical protein